MYIIRPLSALHTAWQTRIALLYAQYIRHVCMLPTRKFPHTAEYADRRNIARVHSLALLALSMNKFLATNLRKFEAGHGYYQPYVHSAGIGIAVGETRPLLYTRV